MTDSKKEGVMQELTAYCSYKSPVFHLIEAAAVE